jgi:DNA invertase Pin-like site-specific DNA recombinase
MEKQALQEIALQSMLDWNITSNEFYDIKTTSHDASKARAEFIQKALDSGYKKSEILSELNISVDTYYNMKNKEVKSL